MEKVRYLCVLMWFGIFCNMQNRYTVVVGTRIEPDGSVMSNLWSKCGIWIIQPTIMVREGLVDGPTNDRCSACVVLLLAQGCRFFSPIWTMSLGVVDMGCMSPYRGEGLSQVDMSQLIFFVKYWFWLVVYDSHLRTGFERFAKRRWPTHRAASTERKIQLFWKTLFWSGRWALHW